jgi:hypothetical protein
MPFEVITCPLSACFLGMSSTQADVARSLRLSDARDPQFDRDDARAAYAVLAGPSQTGDGEPSFFDRMFRRVGRSPLSRGRAEATATLFLAALCRKDKTHTPIIIANFSQVTTSTLPEK